MKFYVIGDEDTVLGFRLAGIEGKIVSSGEAVLEALEKVFKIEDMGVIIIPERLTVKVRKQIDRYIYKTTFPLIIEIPDRLGPMEGRGSVRDLIRKAVGVNL